MRRTREQAAVAELVSRVFGSGVRLAHYPDGAPRIEGRDVNISVSHSILTAVLAVNIETSSIGIDVEIYRPKLVSVAPRIFSEEELTYYSTSEHHLLTGWTLKEAIYKADRTPGLDFRQDIRLGIPPESAASTPSATYLPYFHTLPSHELLTVVERRLK